MNKFRFGDRVVVTGAGAATHFGLTAGMVGDVDRLRARLDGTAVRVRMSDGRLFWFRPDQLDHTPREALATETSLQERARRQAVLDLSEAARSLGVAQAVGDTAAMQYWGAKVTQCENAIAQKSEPAALEEARQATRHELRAQGRDWWHNNAVATEVQKHDGWPNKPVCHQFYAMVIRTHYRLLKEAITAKQGDES